MDFPLATPMSVAELKLQLASKGDQWQKVFTELKIIAAVNQVMSDDGTMLASGDEVAFFPPVTGG